jgi:diguanylate cyclase (GGDEF)-like protein
MDQQAGKQFDTSLLLMGCQPVACEVTEVSRSGISLRLMSSKDISSPGLDPVFGDMVSVLVRERGEKVWRVPAQFSHIRDDRVELVFEGAPPQEVNRLARILAEIKAGSVEASSVLDALEKATRKYAKHLIEHCQSSVDETLFLEARDAVQNQDQVNLLGIRNQFREKKEVLVSSYTDTVAGQIRSLETRDAENITDTGSFTLIDKDTLDDFLDLKEVVTHIYEEHGGVIETIRQRFEKVVGISVEDDVMAVSPEFLCQAFRAAVSGSEIEISVLGSRVYEIFEATLLEGVGSFYIIFNNIMIEAGVLPDLEISNLQASQLKKERKNRKERDEEAKAAGHSGSYTFPSLDVIDRQDLGAPTSTEDQVAQTYKESPESLYQTVRGLMSLSKRKGKIHRNQYEEYAPSNDELVSIIEELEQNLDTADLASRESVRQAIEEYLSSESGNLKPLSVNHDDSIQLFESMFEAIVSENNSTENMQGVCLNLKTAMLKRVVLDESFFSNRNNPTRHFLNEITRVSGLAENISDRQVEHLDRIVGEISDASPYDSDILYDKLSEIQEMLDKIEELRKRQIERLVTSCEGKEKLTRANYKVNQLLGRYTQKDGTIPRIVQELLNAGWRQYLLLTFIRQGGESEVWHQAIEDFRTLLGWFLGETDEQGFIDRIQSIEKDYIADFIGRLGADIDSVNPGQGTHEEAIGKVRLLTIGEQYNAHAVEGVSLDEIDGFISEEEEKRALDERDLRLIEDLQCGDWINRPDAPPSQAQQVVWIGHARARMALVDRSGHKQKVFPAEELAGLVRQGWRVLHEDERSGAVDRGIYKTLQDVYQQLSYQRCHDELTGLVNRQEFERLISNMLDPKFQDRPDYHMLVIDIDQFALVNNLCGHHEGDEFLCFVADVLRQQLPEPQLISRIGGNEFAAVVENNTEQECVVFGEKIREAIHEKVVHIHGQPYQLTACAGLSGFNNEAESVASIFRHALSACATAKEQGRNKMLVYAESNSAVKQHDSLQDWFPKISKAINEDELFLKAQKIDPLLADDALPHYEILLGYSEDGAPVPIFHFISAAEYFNKMHEVDRWVISKLFEWVDRNISVFDRLQGVSINLSGTTLGDDDFLEFLVSKLSEVKLRNEKICFEVTETSAIENIDKAIAFITEIRKLGCSFSLDDFGTGFSSYEYLKRLPVDYIKIDGVFIKNIDNDEEDLAVVRSICEIGHYMGKKIIAEFVETEEIRDILATVGVDYVQGFGIEMPAPIDMLVGKA